MYNKTARCFAIDKFLNEITLKENIDVLYELPAFCIMGDYRLQKAIMLVGTGKNGKSVYLNLLKHMLGATNISAESLQDLEKSPFSACNLFGKLANIFPDLSTETLTDSSMFKTLTSNHDTISAQHKFKDKFTFVNNAKLIFSCNQPPRTRDVSDAFFRRWQILSFPFAFEGEQEDKMLIDKLTTEEELSGFFNKVLECYYRLSTDNKFSIEMPVDKVRDFYTELSDPVGNFIRLKIEVAPSEGLVKREVYNKFCEYCEEVKIPIFSEKMFSMTLQRKLTIMEYYSATTVEGDVIRQYCWRGITWKPKDNENKDVVIF